MMMKTTHKIFPILFIMFISALLFSCQFIAANGKGDKMIDDTSIPQPKLTNKIDLSYVGKASCISRLAFSPDGRYLAIVDDPYPLMSTIIIWDLHQGREQTRIENLPPHTNDPDTNLLWGADGKYITFGKGFNEKYPIQFWDPLTGKLIKEIAVSAPCGAARLNRDKSKMLIRTGTTLENTAFRIYDTNAWEFKEYALDNNITIKSISLTSEDKVLIAGSWPKRSVGRTLDGRTPEWFETIARLIDPSGKQRPRHVVLSPPVPSGVSDPPVIDGYSPYRSIVDFTGNKIAFGYGKIIDGQTLEILTYASNEDIKNHKIPHIAKVFSPDGRYVSMYFCAVVETRHLT